MVWSRVARPVIPGPEITVVMEPFFRPAGPVLDVLPLARFCIVVMVLFLIQRKRAISMLPLVVVREPLFHLVKLATTVLPPVSFLTIIVVTDWSHLPKPVIRRPATTVVLGPLFQEIPPVPPAVLRVRFCTVGMVS